MGSAGPDALRENHRRHQTGIVCFVVVAVLGCIIYEIVTTYRCPQTRRPVLTL
jgi:hypothetical protein